VLNVVIIIILLTIFILYKVLRYLEKKDNIKKDNKEIGIDSYVKKESDLNENYNKYYKPKRYITTLNELNFYNILLEITKELDMILFSQVSLYNIISMKDNLDYSTKTKYFNKIASKSIDFVLVDKKNCRIKLCIELDDTTHYKQKRIERDNFINKLFKDLEIDLLRYPVYKVYYKNILKQKIQESIKEHYYID